MVQCQRCGGMKWQLCYRIQFTIYTSHTHMILYIMSGYCHYILVTTFTSVYSCNWSQSPAPPPPPDINKHQLSIDWNYIHARTSFKQTQTWIFEVKHLTRNRCWIVVVLISRAKTFISSLDSLSTLHNMSTFLIPNIPFALSQAYFTSFFMFCPNVKTWILLDSWAHTYTGTTLELAENLLKQHLNFLLSCWK